MVCKGEQGAAVAAFAEEEEAGHAKVVGHHFVYGLSGKFLSDIVPQEGGVASGAITLAVGNLYCQGNAVGYFFDDYVGQGRKVFKHP